MTKPAEKPQVIAFRARKAIRRNPSPTAREATLRAHIKRLESLQEIARTISSDLDIGTVLQTITSTIRRHSGWITTFAIWDPEAGKIQVVAQAGYPPDSTDESWAPDDLLTKVVVQNGTYLLIADSRGDATLRGMPRLAAEYPRIGARSSIGVPLRVDPPHVVLWCYAQRPNAFDADAISYAHAIADHAAVSIRNARLYDLERTSNLELGVLKTRLEKERGHLQRMSTDHNSMTQMVLGGTGLASIVAAVGETMDAPILLADRFFHRVTEALNGDAAVFPTEGALATLLSGQVERRRAFFRVIETGQARRRYLVVPVAAGRDTLGYLVFAESNRVFDETDLQRAEQAAMVVSIKLMNERAAADVEVRFRTDFLADMLAGTIGHEPTSAARAALLGLDLTRPSKLLLIDPDPDPDPDNSIDPPEQLRRQKDLLDLVSRLLGHRSADNHAMLQSGRIVAIVPDAPARNYVRAVELAEWLVEEIAVRLEGMTASIAVSRAYRGAAELRRAHREAIRAMEFMRSYDARRTVLNAPDLGAYSVLTDNADERDVFVHRYLAALEQHDSAHRGPLIETLATFLRNNGQQQKTARNLQIHITTLRYRLDRIQELSEFDLSDSEVRLNLQLALKIRKLRSIP